MIRSFSFQKVDLLQGMHVLVNGSQVILPYDNRELGIQRKTREVVSIVEQNRLSYLKRTFPIEIGHIGQVEINKHHVSLSILWFTPCVIADDRSTW